MADLTREDAAAPVQSSPDTSGASLAYNSTDAENETAAGPDSTDDLWSLTSTQRALFSAFLVLLCTFIQVANLGIVYYERVVADTHRTLLNKLAALTSVYQVGLATVLFAMLIARLSWESGLPSIFCWLDGLLMVFFLVQLLLVYNELIIMRYIYICRLGAVGTLKEEVVLRFIIYANVTLGSFLSLSLVMVIQETGHIYSFCANTVPIAKGEQTTNTTISSPQTYFFLLFLVGSMQAGKLIVVGLLIATCSTHGILGWKIWRNNRGKSYNNSVPQKPKVFFICNANPGHPKSSTANKSSSLRVSLTDRLSSGMFLFLFAISMAPVLFLLPGDMMGATVILVRLSTVSTFLLAMPLSIYVRKPHVRATLLREFKELF